MDNREYIAIIESILFISGEPVKLKALAEFFAIPNSQMKNIMNEMAQCYDFERRGLQLICLDDAYQLTTRPEYSSYIDRFTGVDRKKTLPATLLETIAVIAYKQPITRAEIEAVRGVKSDYAVHKLLEYDLIKQDGRKDVPGKPFLYVTTPKFLRTFSLTSLKDLPVIETPEEDEEE